jgi:uncharacterized membrane protein YfcA
MIDFAWVAKLLPLAGAGFLVGFLVGLTGVGGGALMTPLLISTFGISPTTAVGTDLLYASITKTAGSWRHHLSENVEWPIVLRLAAGSIPGALLLLAMLKFSSVDTEVLTRLIRIGLIFALPVSGLAIVLYPRLAKSAERAADGAPPPPRTLATVAFGFILGLLVTLTSVGSGAIGVSVLAALYPRLPAKRIVGSDVAHAVPLTLVGGLGHLSLGNVDPTLLIGLLCGSIPGILIGARIAGLAPDWLLRPILAIMLCYAAYLLYGKL